MKYNEWMDIVLYGLLIAYSLYFIQFPLESYFNQTIGRLQLCGFILLLTFLFPLLGILFSCLLLFLYFFSSKSSNYQEALTNMKKKQKDQKKKKISMSKSILSHDKEQQLMNNKINTQKTLQPKQSNSLPIHTSSLKNKNKEPIPHSKLIK